MRSILSPPFGSGRILDTVFNYPTLAECYKTAAFDGINRLGSPQDTISIRPMAKHDPGPSDPRF